MIPENAKALQAFSGGLLIYLTVSIYYSDFKLSETLFVLPKFIIVSTSEVSGCLTNKNKREVTPITMSITSTYLN